MEKFLHLYILNGGTAEKAVFPTSISGYEDCEPLLIDSFDYNAKRMGDAPSITATIMYPICLDNIWSTNVYVEFKGEKYFLKQIPTSSKSNTDARFKHEVSFVSERQALNDVYLFDVVGNKEETGVEDIGYVSNSTRFEFNGTIWDLAERINQSLKNSNVDYSIEIPQDKPNVIGEIETNEYKSISFQDTYVGNALQEIYNTFEIPYYFEGKTIKLGHKAKETLTEVFEYGSENALLSIAKNNTNYKVVNRITGTGSSENIPYYYPNPTPMGFVDFYVNGVKDSDTAPLVSIVDAERFNAKFLLSTELRYKDLKFTYTPEYIVRFSGSDKFTSYERDYSGADPAPDACLYYRYANEIVFPKEPRATTETHIVVDISEDLLNRIAPTTSLSTFVRPELPFEYTNAYKVEQYNLEIWVCDNDTKLFKIYSEVIVGDWIINNVTPPILDSWHKNSTGGRHIEYTAPFTKRQGNRILVCFTIANANGDSLETSNGVYTPILDWVSRNISINAIEEDVEKGWQENGNATNLNLYGIAYSGKLENGTTITVKQNETKGSKIPQCSNLMPSIYRESNGAERFYNAVNYGNKNLILNSSEKFENKDYLLARYNLEHADIKEGERVTISFYGEFGNGYATFRLFGSDSSAPIVTGITTHNFNKNTGRFEYSFTWKEYGDNKQLLIFQADENRNNISSGSSVNPNRTESKIWDIKLEYGNNATKYIPAIGESNAYDSYLSPISEEDEYYEFANTYNGYNPKEHTINFEDIKPTIKEMEHNGLRIDMFEDFAYDLEDNNDKKQINESTLDFKHPYFFGKLRPLGFNLFDRALDKGFMTINMTSGHVSGAKFEIEVGGESKVNLVRVDEEGNLLRDDKGDVVIGGDAQDKQNNTTNNYVWVALKKDAESFSQENKDWVYPDYKNNIVPKAKEDTFVITNILLPNEYIIAAEKRLDEELLAYLFQNNNEKFTFSIKFSRIYLAEHPNVYENLSENSTVNVKYNGFTYAFYVSSYAYKMRANEALPEITVELTDTLTISQSALQNALNEVKQSVISIGQANVLKTGNKYFTRKDVDDTTQGKLTFMRGAEFGEYIEGNKGATVRKSDSGEWDAEFDNVKVRGKIQGALKVDGSIEVGTYAEYEDGTGNGFGVHGSDETGWNTSTDDLKVRRNARFNKGLTVGNYINGLADGAGASISGNNEDGWTIEADYLNIRRKARFNSVEIQHTQHVGGGQVLSAAGALIDLVILHEEDNGNIFYRCYFKKQDSEGNAIFNRWMIGDQARCETFNLSSTGNENGNHYYWRLVTGTSNKVEGTTTNIEPDENAWVTDGEDTIFIHEYHWVDLCDTEYYYTYGKGLDVNSDIPKKGDDIFLLGHRFDTNKNRQSAIYEVAGDDSGVPYYRQYVGINSFSLDGCLEQQFMPNDNIFSGKVVIKGGSGMKNFDDYNEVLEEIEATIGDKVNVQFSNSNLLVNSGFYGDAKSLDIDLGTTMNVDTEMFSPSLLNWANNNAIVESNEDNTTIKDSLSGFVCVLDNGSIAQQLGTAVKDESYVFSLRAIGSFSLSFAGYSETFEVTDTTVRKVLKFKAQSTTKTPILTISGTGTMCELMLERGTITSATWARSVLDVTPEASRLQNLQYLANAIREGSTDILGGLILSNIIMLGNYVNGKMKQVTSGISGTYNQDNDVSYWAGGTLEGAIQAVTKFIANPFYEPTPEESASFAKAIITHGGKAILQDAIVRGNIYADNGIFKGEVNATSGTFVNGKFDNVVINGAYNRLVISITPQNSHEYIYTTNGINHALLLKWGDVVYLDEDYSGEITFPYLEPVYDEGTETLSYTGELGWKIDKGQIVRMEESDVRSLVGRQIAIYGRKINGAGININCGMHKEVFASDTQTEVYTISNPYSENTASYNWKNEQAKVASLGLTIATCILAQKHYTNSDGVPSSAEMITWSIQYMPMMNGSVDTALAYFWYKIDGTDEQFEFKFYDGWTWAQFVKSQFNNNGAFDVEPDGKVIYVIGENESLDVYKYFGSGDSVYANDKIENGITYSNTYTE